MARKLDKSKPYATIHHSEASDGRCFEQDHVQFDAQGNEWTAPAAHEVEAVGVSADLSHPDVQAAIAAEVAKQLAALNAAKPSDPAKASKADKNLQG